MFRSFILATILMAGGVPTHETAQTNAEEAKAGQKGTVILSPDVSGLSHHELSPPRVCPGVVSLVL